MRRVFVLCLLAVGACILLSPVARAIDIGTAGPSWKNLAGVDGKPHSLDDLKPAKAVVVCFTCNHCPVAVTYEDRLIQFAKDYKEKGVDLVAINVNNMEADKLPAMKQRAEEKGFNFAYLYDPSQEIARQYGATCTPHVFLLDGDRKVVYMGAIDDNNDAAKASEHYLRSATDAVLAGHSPETTTTRQRGCGIAYDKK